MTQIINCKVSTIAPPSLPTLSGLPSVDFDPSVNSSLIINAGKVSQITDVIGGLISSQATGTKQPAFSINGGAGNNAYMTFSGAQVLSGNLFNASNPTSDYTMVIVRRASAALTPSNTYGIVYNGNSNANGYGWADMQPDLNYGNYSGGFIGGTTSNQSKEFITVPNKWEICFLSHSNGINKIYNSYGIPLSCYAPAVNMVTPVGSHSIGQIPGGAYWQGDISRILFYSRQLSDSEVLSLATTLRGRYNILSPSLYILTGDSMTATIAGTNPGYNYPLISWQALISSKYFCLFNMAVSGRTSQQMLTGFNTEVIARLVPGVKIVFSILAGHNDFVSSPNLPNCWANTASMINQVLSASPKATILLFTIPYTTLYSNTIIDNYNNNYIKTLGPSLSPNVIIVDFNQNSLLIDPSNATYYTDGTHFALPGAQVASTQEQPYLTTYL